IRQPFVGSSSASFAAELGDQNPTSWTLAISACVMFQAKANSCCDALLIRRCAAVQLGPITPDQSSATRSDANPPIAIHHNRAGQLALVRAAGVMTYPHWASAAATVCESSTARASASRAA